MQFHIGFLQIPNIIVVGLRQKFHITNHNFRVFMMPVLLMRIISVADLKLRCLFAGNNYNHFLADINYTEGFLVNKCSVHT